MLPHALVRLSRSRCFKGYADRTCGSTLLRFLCLLWQTQTAFLKAGWV